MQKIATGAEAIVYEENGLIVKERVSKKYRIPELDKKLIKARTKKEAKILVFLHERGMKVPKIVKTDANKIFMEKINGPALKHVLNDTNYENYMETVGEMVAVMHNLNIIHGDLTTMNFLYCDAIYMIDFGLSFNSNKSEDKAVDLYVFERAIKCGHNEEYLKSFYKGYEKTGSVDVLTRLESVRLRGRKREEQ